MTRRPLPVEREAVVHKFTVGSHEGYITVGLYPDGNVGEVFICMSKEGSTVSGFIDTIAILISTALQHGVPLDHICTKFENMRFEPAGVTEHPDIPYARSVIDYIGRWLRFRFLGSKTEDAPAIVEGMVTREMSKADVTAAIDAAKAGNEGEIK